MAHIKLQPGQYLHTCMTKLKVEEAASFVGGVWTCDNKSVQFHHMKKLTSQEAQGIFSIGKA